MIMQPPGNVFPDLWSMAVRPASEPSARSSTLRSRSRHGVASPKRGASPKCCAVGCSPRHGKLVMRATLLRNQDSNWQISDHGAKAEPFGCRVHEVAGEQVAP